eukprot:3676186-Pyramimonas_sp.AAC.1
MPEDVVIGPGTEFHGTFADDMQNMCAFVPQSEFASAGRRQGRGALAIWERAATSAQTKGPHFAYKAHLATVGAQRGDDWEWGWPQGSLRLADVTGMQLRRLRLFLRSTEWSVLQNGTRREGLLAAGVPFSTAALP